MDDLNEKISIARFQVIKKWAYLATMLYNLRPKITDKLPEKTMAVDKYGRLYIHPEIEWTPAQMAGVLAHECWHLLRLHFQRFEGHDPTIANYAEDMAINDDLIRDGAKLPGQPLLPNTFGFQDNLIEEEYYTLLIKNAKKVPQLGNTPGSGGDCGSCVGGPAREWEDAPPDQGGSPGISPLQMEAIRHKVAQDIKQRGSGHGDAERWADEVLEPRVDPLRILRAFVASMTRPGYEDFAYNRPNRRSDDLVLPILRGQSLPELAFLIDTSGSMGAEDLALALGTVQKALKGGARITIFIGDDEISGERSNIHSLEDVRKIMRGGGGTDMGAIIDKLADGSRKIKGLLVVSDGYTPWTDNKPKFPCAVLLTNEGDAMYPPPDWMKVIRLHEKR